MRDNIEAIRLAFRLGVAGRSAQTAEEREILRKYAGFGGLKCILNDANELADAAKWSKSDIELFAPTVELRRLIHDYSKDDKEFARYMDSLKASVLTAFYTDNRMHGRMIHRTSYSKFNNKICKDVIGKNGKNALAHTMEKIFPKLELAVILMYLSMFVNVLRPSRIPCSNTPRSF